MTKEELIIAIKEMCGADWTFTYTAGVAAICRYRAEGYLKAFWHARTGA